MDRLEKLDKPPCQEFSLQGRQAGPGDVMWVVEDESTENQLAHLFFFYFFLFFLFFFCSCRRRVTMCIAMSSVKLLQRLVSASVAAVVTSALTFANSSRSNSDG